MEKDLPEERSVLVEEEPAIIPHDILVRIRAYQEDLACMEERMAIHHIAKNDRRLAKIRAILMDHHHLTDTLTCGTRR